MIIFGISSIFFLFTVISGYFLHDLCLQFFNTLALPLTILLTIIWLFSLYHNLRPQQFSTKFVNKNIALLFLLCSAIVLFMVMFTTKGFKTLTDEAILASVSGNIAQNGIPTVVTESICIDEQFLLIKKVTPSRPLLFQTLSSILHIFSGYRYQNLIIFNVFLYFVLLLLVTVWCYKAKGLILAIAAALLISSYPIFPIYASSASYDLFSIFFWIIIFYALDQFLRKRTKDAHCFLVFSLLMLSYIRYESIIFVGLIPILLLPVTPIKKIFYQNKLYGLIPLFLTPFFWQRILVTNRYQIPAGKELFSFANFFANGKVFISQFSNFDLYLPYNGVLNILGLLIMVLLLLLYLSNKITISANHAYFYGILTTCAALGLFITLSHHSGRYDHPWQARLFFIPCTFFAFQPIFLNFVFPHKIKPIFLLIIGIACYCIYAPIATKDDFINSQMIIRYQQAGEKILTPLNPKKTIVVSDSPVIFHAMGFNSLHFRTMQAEKDMLIKLIHSKKIENVFVFLLSHSITGKMIQGNDQIHEPLFGFSFKILETHALPPNMVLRIGKMLPK